VGAAAVLVALVATAGLLGLRGSGSQPSSSLITPPGTGVVARLPVQSLVAFSWAPDGAHLLVSDEFDSVVYDRFGKPVGEFGPGEGWLDAGHLIDGEGHVYALTDRFQPKPDQYPWYGSVVANGHGAAAIIVAVPGCVGDPLVDWYRNGRYVQAYEQVSPYGWSPDGRLLLKGHLECTSMDAEMHGWKGRVDVADFATGRVVATVPAVRGEMAFNPSATRLAAQSDADLEVVNISDGQVRTLTGTRFLGWLDDDHLYVAGGTAVEIIDLAAEQGPGLLVASGEWQIPSPAGPRLVAGSTGGVRRIVAADGTTVLLDLSLSALAVDRHLDTEFIYSAMQPQWWSPDGRMLALESTNGMSLVLLSVELTDAGSEGVPPWRPDLSRAGSSRRT
jgi:hypothetical protein